GSAVRSMVPPASAGWLEARSLTSAGAAGVSEKGCLVGVAGGGLGGGGGFGLRGRFGYRGRSVEEAVEFDGGDGGLGLPLQHGSGTDGGCAELLDGGRRGTGGGEGLWRQPGGVAALVEELDAVGQERDGVYG